MSLTDDLKDGKLCTDDYFYNDHHAKGVCRVIENFVTFAGNEKEFFYSDLKEQGFEVLAPCDHFVDLNNMVEQLKKENISLIKENNGIRHDYIHNLQREEQNRQLLKECKKALEWYAQCKCSKSMIDKEGIIFEFADKANKALIRINEVLK